MAELASARDLEAEASAALSTLREEFDRAKEAQSTALEKAREAQDALMRARVRLGELITAQEAAVSDLERAAARVEGARAGSKARRSAFTEWQMAAVTERAAHARRSVGEDLGARLFAKLRSAEAALADAELTLGEAASSHRKAERAAGSASARVAELEELITPAGGASMPTMVAPRAAEALQP